MSSTGGTGGISSRSNVWKQWLNRLGPFIGLLAIFAFFAAIGPESFSSVANLKLIARQTAIVGVAALATVAGFGRLGGVGARRCAVYAHGGIAVGGAATRAVARRWLFDSGAGQSTDSLRAKLARLVYHTHFIRHTRHYPGFHQKLVDLKLATWFGQVSVTPTGRYPNDVGEVVKRIQALASS